MHHQQRNHSGIDELASHKISVLIDGTSFLFSERLIRPMIDCGFEVNKFFMGLSKPALVRWACELKLSRTRILHFIGGNHRALYYIIPKLVGKKVIVHWIGSDVLSYAAKEKGAVVTYALKLGFKLADLHLAVSTPLVNELRLLGIKAEFTPIVPEMPTFDEKGFTWPSADKVYVYLPESREEFYGSTTVFRLAKEMSDIEFIITGHSGKGMPQFSNIRYLDWIDDMEVVWKEVKIYLRLTEHDGLPNTIIEALARGKYVIWSYEFPHCLWAKSYKDAKEAIRYALRQKGANDAGRLYAQHEFDPVKIAEDLKSRYLKLA